MNSRYPWQTKASSLLATAAIVAIVSCTSDLDLGRSFDVDAGNGSGTPSFTPGPEAGAGANDASTPIGAGPDQCVDTECPAPFGTCPNSRFKCDIDFQTDDNNCGGCGNVCPVYNGGNGSPQLQMETHCRDGACVIQCSSDYANCNSLVDDGCEVSVKDDPNNCGACGVKCPSGMPCIDGYCGCRAPNTLCQPNDRCVNLANDVFNCGACGNVCDDSGRPAPPDYMSYTCLGSECGKLVCAINRADCNGDLFDGCETLINTTDNCGSCGVACAPGEVCASNSSGKLVCQLLTGDGCPQGQTHCDFTGCVNLLSSPANCGGCKVVCPGVTAAQVHAQPECFSGQCGLTCDTGYGDCDGERTNGCETNLSNDPANCGACGNQCDLSAGQPCVRGVCVTKPCEEGPTK